MFIVDAVDRDRFPEARKELDVCKCIFPYVNDCNLISVSSKGLLISEELANVPFLILGNKIDLGKAVSEEELRHSLGLHETYGKDVIIHSNYRHSTLS